MWNETKFSDLMGKTITKIERIDQSRGDELVFTIDNGDTYSLYHSQDCCESVYIEDIIGEFDDLLNTPILMADEAYNSAENEDDYESSTWTFYKLATIKGYVTIRWFGSSNGYYSESVDFCKN